MTKIVVLVGSPRRKGNTDILADAFIKGAESAGHQVAKFHVADTKVNGCIGCDYCGKHNGECVQKDGMQDIYKALYEADTVVFATPLYYYGISSQLKAIIDRFYAGYLGKPYPITSSVFLMTLGATQKADCDMSVAQYHTISRAMQWEDKGVILAEGVLNKGDIVGHKALLKAEELGKQM